MSLSIDYITMPPKSQEVSQIQHGDQVRYEHAQQEVASQVQQQVHQNSHQTIRRSKAENKDYLKEEEKRKGKKGSGGKGSDHSEKRQQEESGDPRTGGSFFDMKV